MKNANSSPRAFGRLIFGSVLVTSLLAASAAQAIDARSNTKINNAKAKAWTQGKQDDPALQKSVVNIGSKRNNSCNVNIGTAKPGEKAPKEIVVATKEVINVCK